MMMSVCPSRIGLVYYPPEGLINSNFFIGYNYSQLMENPTFQFFILSEGLKCRGYFVKTTGMYFLQSHRISIPFANHPLCALNDSEHKYRDYLSPLQNDKFCWNDSLTFNGRPYAVNPDICSYAGECISQYRIRDGTYDCFPGTILEDEDMILEKNYCTGNVGRYRFQCFDDKHKCLPLDTLGVGYDDCSNSYDEKWYGTGVSLRQQIPCYKGQTTDCHRLKTYIQQSSVGYSSNSQRQESTNRIPFRLYCNSFWDLDKHVDEMSSSCRHWVCQNHEYQCRTGQCIAFDSVCDSEWDCADASDEEAIVLVEKWSIHNAGLPNLPSQVEKCRKQYSRSPFSNICNTSFEFGCYLSRVSNPLDIQLNRPCINLTQIGDGIEDCYNAYDEKNTFTANLYGEPMWGFHFRCESVDKKYQHACYLGNNCSEILCSKDRDKTGSCSDTKDFICLGDDHCKKNARCDGKLDCFHGEDEYWCLSSTFGDENLYRFEKEKKSDALVQYLSPIWYPPEGMLMTNQQKLSASIISLQNDQFFKVHSYQCNRGVAVLQMNETQCLCPPAYYGRWCEFFSDRVSIIAHVDQKMLPKTISNITLKIKANFLFNNAIIDHHEFDVVPIFERVNIVKHKFYLLYSRSALMLAHKQWRYFNRSDVINNHPYSVHFDVFTLEKNNSVEKLGSWHYPVYFDYLPAFRLAIVLKFPTWFGNATLDPCWQNSCIVNSTCMPVFNQNNSYYCSCKSGYYGTNCSMYESRCNTYCSVSAFCLLDDYNLQATKNKPHCICPLGHFGPRCNLKYDDCSSNSCFNNGTCLPNYDRSGEKPYKCNCSQRFYGNRCQNEKTSVLVALNMTKALSARATVMQLYNYLIFGLALTIQHQKVYYGLPSTIRYYSPSLNAPTFGVLKIYEGLSHPQYFIMYVLNRTVINITSSPQYCPHASSLLSTGEFLINNNIHIIWIFTVRNRSVCFSCL
jgi:hypothetical protein